MNSAEADHETTVDGFLDGRLMLAQPARAYRAGLDAILLAAACPLVTGPRLRVLDCGAGVGAVGLSIGVRHPAAEVVLVERDPTLAALAEANIERNAMADRARVIEAEIGAPLSRTPGLAALGATFDHVVANPPYFAEGAGTAARDDRRRAAHAMTHGALDGWMRFAAAMARDGGSVTVIHRVEALGDLLAALDGRFGALRILPIQATETSRARRLLISGIKGSRAPLTLLPALIVHGRDGAKYSAPVEAIVRDGAPLVWPEG